MFDFLKKKIGNFISDITKKGEENVVEKKIEVYEEIEEPLQEVEVHDETIETAPKEIPIQKQEKPQTEKTKETKKEKQEETKVEPKKEIAKKSEAKKANEIEKKPKAELSKKIELPKAELPKKVDAAKPIGLPKPVETKEIAAPIEIPKIAAPAEKKILPPVQIPKIEITKPAQKKVEEKKPEEPKKQLAVEKPKERVKLSIISAVKSIITQEVEIGEKDVTEMLDSFELELLEADVDLSVAEIMKTELEEKLIGSKIKKQELHGFVAKSIKQTLVGILTNEKIFTIEQRLGSNEKPIKIMFIGINGAGKTTTIAKVTKMLQDNNKKVVLAAADTFRAAAIEQLGVHADRLGVRMIKREYGSDPTSVAFDAVNYAKAHGLDAVLIDTAGRQDTNISLINEVKKMVRVIQPDIKIYIGESIAGNAILEQINTFNREIGIDGVILSKMDCDPKGGTMLSISKVTGIPIIYVGTGQKYEDLEQFDPEKIAERIVG